MNGSPDLTSKACQKVFAKHKSTFAKHKSVFTKRKFAFQNTNPNFDTTAQNSNSLFETQIRILRIKSENTNLPFKTQIRVSKTQIRHIREKQIRFSKHKSEF